VGRRQLATVLALVGVTATVTACGVSHTVDPVSAAASKTEQAGGAKMTMSVDVTDGTTQKTVSITADGAFDQKQGEMTVDMSSVLQSAELPSGSASEIKFLYLEEDGNPVMYMNFPPLASKLPGGKSWIRLDLEQTGKSLGVDFNQLMSQSSQNPAQTLDMLRANGQVDKVGPDTVNGVATTEYKGTIDLAKAAELHGGAVQQLVQRLIAQGAPSDIPFEAWIGDDGLVRRVRMTQDIQTGGKSLSAVVTIDMSDFGTDVSVSAPPADEVFDATGLAAAMAAQWQTGTTTG
jgi:hypothetical protein